MKMEISEAQVLALACQNMTTTLRKKILSDHKFLDNIKYMALDSCPTSTRGSEMMKGLLSDYAIHVYIINYNFVNFDS